jgi:hypothetical protein
MMLVTCADARADPTMYLGLKPGGEQKRLAWWRMVAD